ncbi:Spy/CpxP family protein refolding chaperone [Dyella sp.]|jgi:Spy/CpxP family protein refolding chaperone|uniref:Spy/CpxP family protein refolding chaperone n=1 Tax=Dyella sp. TaxID=1869338 RepID=UPI002D76BD99|nr:Spy/CpxP family protein refolding chaperone [Dyella sp.]HET6432633.1 Spy/CpxP family protein refolding chaperone [Dyella sp.]
MRKTTSLGLILASALTLSTLAVAGTGGESRDGGRFHGHHGRHEGMRHAFAKLDLSDAQKASIKQITQASREQNKSQWQALRTQREAFESLTPDQPGYQAAAARLAQAEGDATRQRVEQRARIQAQVYAVLTPTQKAKLLAMRTERQARREQWQQFRQSHPLPATDSAQ